MHALPTFSNKTYGKANNDIRIISFLIHILPQKSRLAEHTTNIELKIQVHHFFGSFTIKMFSLSTKKIPLGTVVISFGAVVVFLLTVVLVHCYCT